MTRHIDTDDMKTLLEHVGASQMMAEMAGFIRDDFLAWPRFQMAARTAHHSKQGVIELMPVGDDTLYAFKYVNGHPGNPRRQLSTVMAFGVLAEVATGYPLLLSELTITTALRTAATSVLAARALARPGARSMALIGNGAQAEFQALAFMDQLGIRELRVFDIDPLATAKFLANLDPLIRAGELQVLRAGSAREAVQGAHIVTTLTADKSNAAILTVDMVEPGMHINAVGGDCPGKTELAADVVLGSKVFVEYEAQTRIEGELQQVPADFCVTELWEVLAGRANGRDHHQQVTLFDSVGFALEDLSTLRYLHQLAKETGVGRQIELVPSMPDPKDLYGFARSRAAVAHRGVAA